MGFASYLEDIQKRLDDAICDMSSNIATFTIRQQRFEAEQHLHDIAIQYRQGLESLRRIQGELEYMKHKIDAALEIATDPTVNIALEAIKFQERCESLERTNQFLRNVNQTVHEVKHSLEQEREKASKLENALVVERKMRDQTEKAYTKLEQELFEDTVANLQAKYAKPEDKQRQLQKKKRR